MDPRLNDTLSVRYATQQTESGKFIAKAFLSRHSGAGSDQYEIDFGVPFETADEALVHARDNLDSRLRGLSRGG